MTPLEEKICIFLSGFTTAAILIIGLASLVAGK